MLPDLEIWNLLGLVIRPNLTILLRSQVAYGRCWPAWVLQDPNPPVHTLHPSLRLKGSTQSLQPPARQNRQGRWSGLSPPPTHQGLA